MFKNNEKQKKNSKTLFSEPQHEKKYTPKYSNIEAETENTEMCIFKEKIDDIYPVDKKMDKNYEKRRQVDKVKKWGFINGPIKKDIYLKKKLSSFKLVRTMITIIALSPILERITISFLVVGIITFIFSIIHYIYTIFEYKKIKKEKLALFDEEFINEIGLSMFIGSIAITKNFIFSAYYRKVFLIDIGDVVSVSESKNRKITINLINGKKIKIWCKSKYEREYLFEKLEKRVIEYNS